MDRLSRDEVVAVITEALSGVADDLDAGWDGALGADAPILGDGGLSSLTLVAAIVEIEERMEERLGTTVTLTSDAFWSARRSPLATVGTLADFMIEEVSRD